MASAPIRTPEWYRDGVVVNEVGTVSQYSCVLDSINSLHRFPTTVSEPHHLEDYASWRHAVPVVLRNHHVLLKAGEAVRGAVIKTIKPIKTASDAVT